MLAENPGEGNRASRSSGKTTSFLKQIQTGPSLVTKMQKPEKFGGR